VKQRLIQFRRQRHARFHFLGRVQQLAQRCRLCGSRNVLVRRALEVQGADTVRAGFQKTGQLVERADIGILAFAPEDSVQDDAAAPRVRRAVAQASGQAQPGAWRDGSAFERKFRLVDRNRIFPVQIALAVIEKHSASITCDTTGDDRLRLSG
jgi:hypothetical protein